MFYMQTEQGRELHYNAEKAPLITGLFCCCMLHWPWLYRAGIKVACRQFAKGSVEGQDANRF